MNRTCAAITAVVFAAVAASAACARKAPRTSAALTGPRTPGAPNLSRSTPDRSRDAARKALDRIDSVMERLRQGSDVAATEPDAPRPETSLGTAPGQPTSTGGRAPQAETAPVTAAPEAGATRPRPAIALPHLSLPSAGRAVTQADRAGAILLALGLIGAVLAVPRWLESRRRRR